MKQDVSQPTPHDGWSRMPNSECMPSVLHPILCIPNNINLILMPALAAGFEDNPHRFGHKKYKFSFANKLGGLKRKP